MALKEKVRQALSGEAPTLSDQDWHDLSALLKERDTHRELLAALVECVTGIQSAAKRIEAASEGSKRQAVKSP